MKLANLNKNSSLMTILLKIFKRHEKIVQKTRKNVIIIFMLQLTSMYLNYDMKKCYANVPNDFKEERAASGISPI